MEDVINFINENPPVIWGGEPLTPEQVQRVLWDGVESLKREHEADILEYWAELRKIFGVSDDTLINYNVDTLIDELVNLDLFDTLQNTPDMVYMIDLNLAIHNDIFMEDVLANFLKTKYYKDEIQKLCSVQGNLVLYITLSLENAVKLSKINGKLTITNGLFGVINMHGKCVEALMETVEITINFNKNLLFVDGVYFPVSLLNKKLGEGTLYNWTSEEPFPDEFDSLLQKEVERDRNLTNTFKSGGCTQGDVVQRRHRHIITDKRGKCYCVDCGQVFHKH